MSATEAPESLAGDLMPVRVLVRQLDYITKGRNPLGDEVDKIATAYGPGAVQNDPTMRQGMDPESQEFADLQSDFRYGQLIQVRSMAYVGLINSGVVRPVQTNEETGVEIPMEDEELLDINTATVDELADWIRTERPTVSDVLQASNGEAEIAKRLLEAESQANDGEPRKGAVTGLTAVISRG